VPVLRDDRAPVDALLDGMVGQRYVRVRTNESAGGTGADGADASAQRVVVPATAPHG
jgi:hypothetical protein